MSVHHSFVQQTAKHLACVSQQLRSAPTANPSAFLVSQNSGTAHLLCIISFIRLTGHVIGLPSLHGELSEVLFITGNPYCNSSIWLQMV